VVAIGSRVLDASDVFSESSPERSEATLIERLTQISQCSECHQRSCEFEELSLRNNRRKKPAVEDVTCDQKTLCAAVH
jgi:hypothetical protein